MRLYRGNRPSVQTLSLRSSYFADQGRHTVKLERFKITKCIVAEQAGTLGPAVNETEDSQRE